MTENIETIKTLCKEAIIELADKILADKHPEIELPPKDYEIKVWANKREVIVKYRRLIRYYPLGKENNNLTYDLSVNVLTNDVSPLDIWPNIEFYVLQGRDKKNFEFVLKHYGLPVRGFNNTVSEEKEYFMVSLTNKAAYGKYFIDKVTGEQHIGSIQGSYMPMPHPPQSPGNIDPDPLVEIKD